jgi:Sulfotransferase domain
MQASRFTNSRPILALRRSEILRAPRLRWRFSSLSDTDILLASYPKSGNTWVKLLLCTLITSRDVGFDESELIIPSIEKIRRCSVSSDSRQGRIIKTHDRFRGYAMRSGRGIYLLRDGRDVAVSYFYHYVRVTRYEGSFSQFLRRFLLGRLDGFGTWACHVIGWMRSDWTASGRLLVVRYEDLLDNPSERVGQIADFLGLERSAEEIEKAIELNTASRMREKEFGATVLAGGSGVPFVRSASAGGWRGVFSDSDHDAFMSAAGQALHLVGY